MSTAQSSLLANVTCFCHCHCHHIFPVWKFPVLSQSSQPGLLLFLSLTRDSCFECPSPSPTNLAHKVCCVVWFLLSSRKYLQNPQLKWIHLAWLDLNCKTFHNIVEELQWLPLYWAPLNPRNFMTPLLNGSKKIPEGPKRPTHVSEWTTLKRLSFHSINYWLPETSAEWLNLCFY